MNPLLETWVSAGPDHNHLQDPYWTIEQAKCPGGHEGTHGNPCDITTVQREMEHGCDEGLTYADLEKRAAIIAAAPLMLRMLISEEWQENEDGYIECRYCDGGTGGLSSRDPPVHEEDCPLDGLFNSLTFYDAASRDAARKLIAELP